MDSVKSTIARYIFPLLLGILGLAILFSSSGQTMYYVIGGISILLVSIIFALYIKGLISRSASLILVAAFSLGAVGLAYLDYKVIDDELKYQAKKGEVAAQVIQRLKDIRTAQQAYEKVHGRYTPSFDTLMNFLRNGQIPIIMSIGTLPDSVPTIEMARELGLVQSMPEGMTEEQVLKAGLIVRDTNYFNVLEYTFMRPEALRRRKYPFHKDSLTYVPFGGGTQFQMNAGFLEVGGVRRPVFEALDPKPFADQYKVGSLTEAKTDGNWRE